MSEDPRDTFRSDVRTALHDLFKGQANALAELSACRETIAKLTISVNHLTEQTKASADHIDRLREAKWTIYGIATGIAGLASFVGSKLAALFSSGPTPPTH